MTASRLLPFNGCDSRNWPVIIDYTITEDQFNVPSFAELTCRPVCLFDQLSNPIAESEIGGMYFLGAAKPHVNSPQTHDCPLGGFLSERRCSGLFNHLIQNLVRSPIFLLIVPQMSFQLRGSIAIVSSASGQVEARRLELVPECIVEKNLILVVR